jgi:hypothetical protein
MHRADYPLSLPVAETTDRHSHTEIGTRACLTTWSNPRQHAMWCRPHVVISASFTHIKHEGHVGWGGILLW